MRYISRVFMQKPDILDDRGRRVPVLSNEAARGDQELVEVLVRFAETSTLMHERLRWGHILWVLAFIAAIAVLAFVGTAFPRVPPWIMGAIWPMGFVSISLFAAARRRAHHVQRLVEGLLHIGRCPSCGYRLSGLLPESDAAMVCPECSAAWNADRVGSTILPLAIPQSIPEHPGDAPPVATRWFKWIIRTPTILDARDRPLPLVNLWAKGHRSPFDPGGRAALRKHIAGATFVSRFLLAGAVFLFGLLFLSVIIMNLTLRRAATLSLLSSFFMVWMVVVYWVLAWRIWTGRSRRTASKARDIIVRHRLCASCGAPLENESADAQRLACPRCRAEWTLTAP